MIAELVDAYDEARGEILDHLLTLSQYEINSHAELLRILIEHIPYLDGAKIEEFGHDDHQGSALLVVQRNSWGGFYVVAVDYGSCSYCDTIQSIQTEDDAGKRADLFATEILHLVQGLQRVGAS